MRYEDFNIRIMAKRDGGYDVSVDSPAGGASEHIKLPFEVDEALERIRQIGGAVRGSATREAAFEAEQNVMPDELGAELYDALFSDVYVHLFPRLQPLLHRLADIRDGIGRAGPTHASE